MRFQVTWYPSDVRPETNARPSARRRRSGVEEEAGEEAGRPDVLVGPATPDAPVPARRSSSSATTPAVAEHAAPARRAPVRPRTSMRTRPASSVPAIAPIVFAAYS